MRIEQLTHNFYQFRNPAPPIDTPEKLTATGNARLKKGKLDSAEESYLRALEIDPEYAEAHYGMARVLEARGEFAGAVEEYNFTIALHPAHTEAHYEVGFIHLLTGANRKALAHFRLYLLLHNDNNPKRVDIVRELIVFLIRRGPHLVPDEAK